MVVTNMFQAVTAFGFVETFILAGKGLARRLVWVRFQLSFAKTISPVESTL